MEFCGALKNLIALVSGILTGLGYEDNDRITLITCSRIEITSLGKKMGCFTQNILTACWYRGLNRNSHTYPQ